MITSKKCFMKKMRYNQKTKGKSMLLNDRRFKILRVDACLMLPLLRGSGRIVNVPAGAKIVSVHHNHRAAALDVGLTHDDFPKLESGKEAPVIMAKLETVKLRAAV